MKTWGPESQCNEDWAAPVPPRSMRAAPLRARGITERDNTANSTSEKRNFGIFCSHFLRSQLSMKTLDLKAQGKHLWGRQISAYIYAFMFCRKIKFCESQSSTYFALSRCQETILKRKSLSAVYRKWQFGHKNRRFEKWIFGWFAKARRYNHRKIHIRCRAKTSAGSSFLVKSDDVTGRNTAYVVQGLQQ